MEEYKKNVKTKKTESIQLAKYLPSTQGRILVDNRKNSVLQKKNNTGLPDKLKSGIENLSGHSMDDVKVHYNSAQPAQLNAHAFAQGNQIHLAPGQEKHLPHEAWHVVQQKQGRVKPTTQLKSKVNINDDVSLEKEADVMGSKALSIQKKTDTLLHTNQNSSASMQFHKPKSKAQKKKDANKRKKKKRKALEKQQQQQESQQQVNSGPQTFSYFDHYMHKLPHLWDLVTSFRRQRMLVTSTLTRTYLHWANTPAYPFIPANEIKLLHPNSLEDNKTRRRYETILQHLRNTKTNTLSAADIGNLIPSDEEIQVAKIGGNSYISLQGVGRIVALKEAGKKAKIGLSIQVATYDLSNFPIIPGQLDGISDSYNIDEGTLSKIVGGLLSTGFAVGGAYVGYLAAGKTMAFASSLASAVYDMMTREVSQRNVETPPFEYQYPRFGTLTE